MSKTSYRARLVVLLGVHVAVAACGASTAPRGESASHSSVASNRALPEQPSREDVTNVFFGVSPEVARCLARYPGSRIGVAVLFESAGTVQTATVLPPQGAGTPDDGWSSTVLLGDGTRGCIESALLAMRLPPFGRETMVVNFPFRGPR